MNDPQRSPEEPLPKQRRRWVKVDVDEEVFASLHLRAAESRMRIQPYLRRFLAEAKPYATRNSLDPSFAVGAKPYALPPGT